MNLIYQTFADLWLSLSAYVPESVLSCLIALSLICLIYFLFLRSIVSMFKSRKMLQMLDGIFFAVCIATVIYYITPSITINQIMETIGTTELTETISEVIST